MDEEKSPGPNSTPSPVCQLNIVLVQPVIPQNTGSIARLCGATDTTLHLVKPLGFKTDDKSLKRAGLDYWEFVDIKYWDDLESFLANCPAIEKMHLLTTKTDKPYTECRFAPGDFLIFGQETKGLPQFMLEAFPQRCATIPMCNKNIRSLNLAMSTAVVLYEGLRQINSSR